MTGEPILCSCRKRHRSRNEAAYADGVSDGRLGVLDHAARWPSGEPGHGDYELGRYAGEQERDTGVETLSPAYETGYDDGAAGRLAQSAGDGDYMRGWTAGQAERIGEKIAPMKGR